MNNRAVLLTSQVKNTGKKLEAGTFMPAPRWSLGSGTRLSENVQQVDHTGQTYPGHSFSSLPVYGTAPGLGVEGGTDTTLLSEIDSSPNGSDAPEIATPATPLPDESASVEAAGQEVSAVSEESPLEPAIIEPVRIVRDKNLWWFDGEDAANYAEEAKLTAFGATVGATRGRFEWNVVRGADKVDFENNSDSMTRINANRITVLSTEASTNRGDVKVQCRWSLGSSSATLFHEFTVFAANEGVVVNGPNDTPWNGGFKSQYAIEVRDQFHQTLPDDIEVNESWGAFAADQAVVNNWFIAPPNGTMTGPPSGPATAQFYETYGMPAGPGRVPQAVNPGIPGSTTPVMHAPQFYRAGSTTVGDGRLIKTHTTRYYRGQGRQ